MITLTYNDDLSATVKQPGRICAVDGCGRPVQARGWCHPHWRRWRKTGGPGAAAVRERLPRADRCGAPGCTRQPYAKGYCKPHYYRWRKHGDVGRVDLPPGWPGASGEQHPCWKGAEIGYAGAHTRVYATRGPARNHACVDGCGQQAEHWSYTYQDPAQQFEPGVGHYSTDPGFYVPRCRPCHRLHDNAARQL